MGNRAVWLTIQQWATRRRSSASLQLHMPRLMSYHNPRTVDGGPLGPLALHRRLQRLQGGVEGGCSVVRREKS